MNWEMGGMPYDYNVQANIIHASRFQPIGSEHILLDTQILLWMFYPKFSSRMLGIDPPSSYQLKAYPNILKSLISAKSTLYYTGLNLPELFHQVERFECGLHSYHTKVEMKTKQFRYEVQGAMDNILQEVETIWQTTKRIAHLIPVSLNENVLDESLKQYGTCHVDGYDRFMLEVMRTAGIPLWILTDDGDFACVKGITVITENQSVLADAYNKGLVEQ
jgi:PIN domain nuclease of toxin-antitoxin system